MRSRTVWVASIGFAAVAATIACVPSTWPRWLFMWLLAGVIYLGLKVLTWAACDSRGVSIWRQAAYLIAWPGMNAARFFSTDEPAAQARPTAREWGIALLKLVAGCAVFWTAHLFVPSSSSTVLGWAGMVGVILMLHFGLFHVLSCMWRQTGIDAQPLMNQPLRSTSVVGFWGRRWNMAFRDLTYQFLFLPLRSRVGSVTALGIGFVISGLVHDLVISLPAGGGYGGPTAFFAIQPVAIVFERSSVGKSIGLGHGWRGWLFTALVLILPARLLFHDRFVTRIVLPFMQAFGAV